MEGSLSYDELRNATKGRVHDNIKNFVETGTYKAGTALMAAKHYENVYTTEIHTSLYEESMKRADSEGITNVTFMLGDSPELLKDIVPRVKEGAVFFIDSHVSGPDSGWNKKQRVPLLEELDVILVSNVGPSVFIFNDVRFWGEVWDWVHVSKIKIVKRFTEQGYNITSFYEENDKFIVITK